MSGVELGLAIFATVDLCFKYGNALVDICTLVKNAESLILERCVRLESLWVRTKCQLDFLKSVWPSINETHRRVQAQILDILVSKLKAALSRMQNVIGGSDTRVAATKVQKLRFALCKEGLDKSLDELTTWQGIFDPSWFLVMRAADSRIDLQLSQADEHSQKVAIGSANHVRDALKLEGENRANIFLPPKGLELARIFDIPLSSMKLAQRQGSSKWLVLDTVVLPLNIDPTIFAKDVREIARKLSCTDPCRFHLFTCAGVVKNHEPNERHPNSFTFVSKLPNDTSRVRSLRDVLCNERVHHSLSERLGIGRGLARAVAYVHNLGFVHKSVRPETILLLDDQTSSLGSPYLAGFESFRSADGRTMRRGDGLWHLDLYRHPDRQGLVLTEDYSMQHDIYSLGVCLLELGLFEPFVTYDAQDTPVATSKVSASDAYSNEIESSATMKDHLVTLARSQLPRRMGTRFTNVTITCLTCLDSENSDFGDKSEFQDEDGILVSVRYIEKVLVQLDEICI